VAEDRLHLRVGEGAGVAVVPVLEAHRAAVQQALAPGALRDPGAESAQRTTDPTGDLLERSQRQGLLIDGVAAEPLVRALTREDDLDVLARLAGDEVQRD